MNSAHITMFSKTIKYNGDLIFVKPFCDFFGIEYDNQCRFINSSPLLNTDTGKTINKSLFGDERERLTLTKQGFITWIIQLRPKIVAPELREKLFSYQKMIFNYLLGSFGVEDQMRNTYARINKLKRLKTKISHELELCQNELKDYLDGRFLQTRLNFPESNQITE